LSSTVYFLSDYGTQDEFVGVVHAILHSAVPSLTVIDLTHQIPAFDVRAGAHALVRAVPYLGAGVVLAVVDPGVGTTRRGLCIEITESRSAPIYFVGPDNGILIEPAELAGEAPITRAFALERDEQAGSVEPSGLSEPSGLGCTFDGRDLFAPVAAALCRGVSAADLGEPVDLLSLVRLPGGVVEHGRLGDGRHYVRTEVLWVDRFGNAQLAATVADAREAGVPFVGTVGTGGSVGITGVTSVDESDPAGAAGAAGLTLRCVQAFADLEQAELGLLVDANGHLAVVAGEASAAHWLTVSAGDLVMLAW
jgi:hypothetical protein